MKQTIENNTQIELEIKSKIANVILDLWWKFNFKTQRTNLFAKLKLHVVKLKCIPILLFIPAMKSQETDMTGLYNAKKWWGAGQTKQGLNSQWY